MDDGCVLGELGPSPGLGICDSVEVGRTMSLVGRLELDKRKNLFTESKVTHILSNGGSECKLPSCAIINVKLHDIVLIRLQYAAM